jgi:hypothetical protein
MGGFLGVLVSILVSIFLSSVGFAAANLTANKCENLIQDLKSMQAAQTELLSSFMKKNETMAEVLDQHADRLEKSLILHQSLKKTDLRSLHLSAEAFRGHQQKETAIVDRFGKASNDLLDQVEACLTSPRKIEKLGQR